MKENQSRETQTVRWEVAVLGLSR